MKTFKQYVADLENQKNKEPRIEEVLELLEHKVYKRIPGERASYREDGGNTSTLTQQHAHVFAKPDGKGKQLYAVNLSGSGHDGSSGTTLSQNHADWFRSQGYAIRPDNILECIGYKELGDGNYSLIELLDE